VGGWGPRKSSDRGGPAPKAATKDRLKSPGIKRCQETTLNPIVSKPRGRRGSREGSTIAHSEEGGGEKLQIEYTKNGSSNPKWKKGEERIRGEMKGGENT